MEKFLEAWGMKLVALVLAVGLWYYAVGEEGIEVTRTVPLEITLKNSQMSILESSTREVRVTLVAPRALLSDLTSKKITASHKIGAEVKNAGDYSFRLEPREIKLPSPQIRVAKIVPQAIQVKLDELLVQKLRVQPNFIGQPAYGYKVGTEEIEMNPNAVLIEGPKGQLEKLDSVKTEVMDLVGRVRSFRKTVALDLAPNLKPLSEALIDIYVPIREEFEERDFDEVSVRILKALEKGRRIKITPQEVSFTLKGPKAQFEKLNSETLLVYVDISSLESGEHNVPLQMILPEDVSLKEDKPLFVTVTVK